MDNDQKNEGNGTFNSIEYRESQYLTSIKLEGKEQLYRDLINVEQGMTGRIDVLFSHAFFNEAIQLIVNSMTLFEKGYFDCAFYSLRESLEISTTAIYFVDDTETNRVEKMHKWKNQKYFPMSKVMLTELQEREKDFADIKGKMASYFLEIEEIKKKLNKYVHKQGYDKFYVLINHPFNKNTERLKKKMISDFSTYLVKCIGAIAVFRLAIDPFPILLAEESIYNRTGQLITEEYSEDFIKKYIGRAHIEAYKQTDLFKGYYEGIIASEEMLPSVVNIVKHEFVDLTEIDEILSQKHLLSNSDIVAVSYFSASVKIAKIYCIGGFKWYFSNIESKRQKTSWSTDDFKIFGKGQIKFNVIYDEVFLSSIQILNEDYYFEHNEEFSEYEIDKILEIGAILSACAIKDNKSE